jgi:hypothetical protein
MLLGIWKNIEELEDALSLPEVEAMLHAMRERENRANRFAAALKGINLDEEEDDANLRKEIMERRVQARLNGQDPDVAEWQAYGIAVESDDDE